MYFPKPQEGFLKTGVPLLRDIFAAITPVTVEIVDQNNSDGYGYW